MHEILKVDLDDAEDAGTGISSLPMYAHICPSLHNRFYADIRAKCTSLDLLSPSKLLNHDHFFDSALSSKRGELFLDQVCSLPFLYNGGGDVFTIVGTPKYLCSGADGSTEYRSVIVIGAVDEDKIKSVKDLSNKTLAINSRGSLTGCLLLAATLRKEIMSSTQIITTGSHRSSIEAVSSGRCDAASIDCYTFALLSKFEPQLLSQIHVLCRTESCLAPPYVTSVTISREKLAVMRQALSEVALSSQAAHELLIAGIDVSGEIDATAYEQRIIELQHLASSSSTTTSSTTTTTTTPDAKIDEIKGGEEQELEDIEAEKRLIRPVLPEDGAFAEKLLSQIRVRVEEASPPAVDGEGEWSTLNGCKSRLVFPCGSAGLTAVRELFSSSSSESGVGVAAIDIVCFMGKRPAVHDCSPSDHVAVRRCWDGACMYMSTSLN